MFWPSLAAAVQVVSDPTDRTDVTHCAWYLDSAERQLVIAPQDANGLPYCALTVDNVAPGSHTVTAAFVISDSIWGDVEGPLAAPFLFTRPEASFAPSGLILVK